MQSNMSETPSVKSRAQQIMDEVMAEEEEKMSMSQSQKGSVAGHEQNEAEEDDDAEGGEEAEGEDDGEEKEEGDEPEEKDDEEAVDEDGNPRARVEEEGVGPADDDQSNAHSKATKGATADGKYESDIVELD